MNKTVRDIDVTGKKVLMRVDYNVPMNKDGSIADSTRIRETIHTIKYLLKKQAAVILISHLGRPDGQRVAKYSLAPVAQKLKTLLWQDVTFVDDCIGSKAQQAAKDLKPGQVLLLENLRYHPEEEKNGEEFSKELASFADIMVNDAFGVSHRAHASVVGISKFLPTVAGFLMEKEVDFLDKALKNPEKPYVAVLGGVKVSDKIGVISSLLKKVNTLIIGGGMANTFLAAQGINVGKSVVEANKFDVAKAVLAEAKERGVNLLLPEDFVVADKFNEEAKTKVVKADGIDGEWMALDIGPATGEKYAQAINGAKLIVWNGPMGVFEMEAFFKGTQVVAKAIAANAGAVSIVGGGDSVSAIDKVGIGDKITHISTGGGASLEFLEGKILPGVAVIEG